MRILAIHAHPDDVEFQCAGTLALLAERGHEVIIATMAPGDCGSVEHGPEEIAEIRRGEARTAAGLIGADYQCLEFRDLAIFSDDPSRRKVVEFLRRVRPDVVITAPPVDYLADHEETSKLVRDACFVASVPNYKTKQWEPGTPLEKIPYLYYVDPIGGVDREGKTVAPDFWVDVTEVWDRKKEMLACHASQRDWLLKQHGIDEYLKVQEETGRARGKEVGVEFAEGFRQYIGHPYPSDPWIQGTLGTSVKGEGRGGRLD